SIFVTNFPEDCGSRDLWKVCEGYGKVVDVYIHNRRSKSGRFHLQANVVRYERASKNVKSTCNPASNVKGNKGSYATAVRGTVPLTAPRVPVLSNPAVVLDESCVISRDLACHVMGKVKDIESIPTYGLSYLRKEANQDSVSEERVVWVDIEGVPLNLWSRETFLKIGSKWGSALDIEDNSGSSFARKRICMLIKEPDSILEKFKMIYTSDGDSVQGDKSKSADAQLSDGEFDEKSDVDGVSETVFGKNSSSHHVSGRDKDILQSEDPFCLFTPDVLEVHKDGGGEDDTIANDVEKEKTAPVHANVMNTNIEVTESSIGESTSIRTGPVHNGGSILDVLEDMVRVGHSMGYNLEGCMKDIDSIIEMVYTSDGDSVQGNKSKPDDAQLSDGESDEESDVDGVSETVFGENSSSHHVSGRDKDIRQSEDPFCLFTPDVLEVHKDGGGEDDTIANDVEKEKIPSVHANIMNTNIKVTKSSIGESTSIRTGPVHNGGSILDVLEDMVRVGHSMGYNLEGLGHKSKKEWIKKLNSKHRVNFLALQETKLERVSHMDVKFLRWNGDSIVMGDFNDVRCKEERLGSLFNPLGARLFNQFINSSGLVEVKLKGYSFTWSHPSASKMSKLDRFLVTEGMLSVFPSMTEIYLDRHFSDHRPILLREVASRDAAQKSKIKWAIEGDENSKFFHGIINKKRSYLSIRGVFVDGIWCTDPVKNKREKDKIRIKPDKNGKRGEAGKSQE
nr:RNA-directed DNA polymerase, eukaryota [Tanacetum cinerariifolium]